MTAAPRVRIALGPSRILAAVLSLAHALALAVILIVTMPVWAKLLVGSVIAASCIWSICHAALLRTAHAIIELVIGEGGRVSCRNRTGTWREAQTLGSSFVTPWLTVLNLRLEGSWLARHVVILPDSVDADAFRRVRVLLRWARTAPGAPSEPSSTRG